MSKISLVLTLLFVVVTLINGQEFTELTGDYLGQTLPGEVPELFAPVLVSRKDQEHGVPAFSPDGNQMFWVSNRPPGPENENWQIFGKTMQRIANKWTTPQASPFIGAIFTSDGQRLYMGSAKEGADVTFVEKKDNGWSGPQPVGLVSRFPKVKFAYMPSITSDNTLYFIGYSEIHWNHFAIYRSEYINEKYTEPELLPRHINMPGNIRNWAPFIAPDESYLIFCSTRGLPASDQGDLFISFRNDDQSWTEPVNMGTPVNSSQMERYSCVSADGKYLFFTRDHTNNYEDVFWVSADIINKLKKKL